MIGGAPYSKGMLPEPQKGQYFKVKELADFYSVSRNTIISWFRNEPGVIWTSGSKKPSMRISREAALRVHHRRGGDGRKPLGATGNPGSIRLFGDRHRGVSKHLRHVVDGDPGQQLPHGEGMAEPVRAAS